MPPVHRKSDTGSGHACHFPPSNATGGSPDVFVNKLAVMRVGDSYAPHACAPCPQPPHPRALAEGSSTVFVNGRPIGRIGDAIDCGGSAASGSGDVFAGG
ncbi:PAAR domain-containing protein [Fulvimarina sp. MAC3]|uniref:PAAR domain-containing protein n=1 Tax=Fulvimarina sp. MAC3 TaxID=3148887 RepID=UPI0031FBCBE6